MGLWRANRVIVNQAESVAGCDEEVPARRWIGFVDRVDRSSIVGWCCDTDSPDQSLAVEAIGSDGTRKVVVACLFRQDVLDAGHGSGHHGFEIKLGSFPAAESVTLRFAASREPITHEPIPLDPMRALLTQVLPTEFVRSARLLAAEVGTGGGFEPGRVEMVDPRLLEPVCGSSDPEGLITRFVAQESARLLRDRHEMDLGGAYQDRLGVLLWFVGDYALSRAATTSVPLSDAQVAALNAPAAIGGAETAITVALHNFVLREMPTHAQLADPALAQAATYWWCVERAPAARLEDRLVTQEQIGLLRREIHGLGSEFPCNVFMRCYRERHPELDGLDLAMPRDRSALLAYLVLASALRPDLLRFLPVEPLRRMLRPDAAGVASLDAVLGRFATAGGRSGALANDLERNAAGRLLRLRCEAGLAAVGLDLRSSVTATGGRFRDGSTRAAVRPGVGVIGPFRSSSGLGRAARLSFETLAAVEATPPALSCFELENPSPTTTDPPPHGSLDAPRAINLLHLNADTVPLAFAYGQSGLLAGRYNIGFFFWELTEIPPCHRLAIDLVDEIWVASEFVKTVYTRHTTKPVLCVGMAAPPLPALPRASRRDYGLHDEHFVFVVVLDALSFIARKNPLGAIEAFRAAFPAGDEPFQLLIKTQNRSQIRDPYQLRVWRRIERALAADPRIVLVDETLAALDLLALMRACDCYVSLHRAEGWGFGLIEAMQLGLPVICTGYSGNADFCTSDTAFLVEYAVTAVASHEYIDVPPCSLWAEPSIISAAHQMRCVVADGAAVARKTEAARQLVARDFSLEAVAGRYARRLAAIRNERAGA